MISKEEALAMLQENITEQSLINHSLQSEAVLAALAEKLDADQELWSRTGLLHDLDYMQTKDEPARHGLESAILLEGLLPLEAVQAIQSHNGDCNGVVPKTDFDFALRCGETVTGLIAANALVRPKGMDGMKPKSLKKKMKDKSFAASVNRDTILECERIGLTLDEFLQIAIGAITPIACKVGLGK